MTEGVEGLSKQTWCYSRQGGTTPMLLLERNETRKSNDLCSS